MENQGIEPCDTCLSSRRLHQLSRSPNGQKFVMDQKVGFEPTTSGCKSGALPLSYYPKVGEMITHTLRPVLVGPNGFEPSSHAYQACALTIVLRSHSRDGGIRTLTLWILNPLPLPSWATSPKFVCMIQRGSRLEL